MPAKGITPPRPPAAAVPDRRRDLGQDPGQAGCRLPAGELQDLACRIRPGGLKKRFF